MGSTRNQCAKPSPFRVVLLMFRFLTAIGLLRSGKYGRGLLSPTMSQSVHSTVNPDERMLCKINGRTITSAAKVSSPIFPAFEEWCLSCL